MARRPAIDRTMRDARDALGLAQHELADALGIAPRTLGRWEHGLAAPQRGARPGIVAVLATLDPAVAAKVADALGVEAPAPAPRREEGPVIEALDGAVYLAADALGVTAASVRPVLARFLLHLAAAGIAPDEARARLGPAGVLAPEGADGSARSARTGAPGAGEPMVRRSLTTK